MRRTSSRPDRLISKACEPSPASFVSPSPTFCHPSTPQWTRAGARQGNHQRSAARGSRDLRVRAPDRVADRRAPAAIAAPGGGRPVERISEVARDHQLDELRMGPGERHRRSGRLAGEQSLRGQRLAVPDLFGHHPARPGHRRHGAEVGLRIVARDELIVAAFAGQQWPAAPAPGAVEGTAVVVLAIAVAVVAVPGRAVRRVGLQERVGDFTLSRISGSVGARSPKRTSWRKSMLTSSS